MDAIRLKPRADISYIGENRTLLGIASDGSLCPGTKGGLIVDETRVLSRYRYLADGEQAELVVGSAVDARRWFGYFLFPPLGARGQPPQDAIELAVDRRVSDGLTEHLTLTNFTQQTVHFRFALELDADFRDVSELESGRREYTPRIEAQGGPSTLILSAHAEHAYAHQGHRGVAQLARSVRIRARATGAEVDTAARRIQWQLELAPHARFAIDVEVAVQIEDETLAPKADEERARAAKREAFSCEATRVLIPSAGSLSQTVMQTVERAAKDLNALRLFSGVRDGSGFVPAAGVPLFCALFGRDSLTTAWQAALLSPQILRGTLPAVRAYQGTRRDDWRDEQPDKMLHQARRGPLSQLEILPWSRNYASVTTSAFWPVALAEAWRWTGDRTLVEPLLDAALRCLRWCDEHGDLDGDGRYEYLGRSEHEQKNQAWKDSEDAIVHADGSQAQAPLGTCEQQAFVYSAKLHVAELCWWFGKKSEARSLLASAQDMKKRFNEFFWMPQENYLALGFDRDKRMIRSITSNPGHCIAAGIVDDALIEPLTRRMFEPDLFSGWGIRTLSAEHPAYNPYAYQRGTVWPVEHGTFALGFMRYGQHQALERVVRAQFEAAALFDSHRLPECFGGQARDAEHPFPCLYPRTNWPQAWSCSAVFCMLQALLGIYPYAPLHLLMVDPHLPSWLPELTLQDLSVGQARVTLRFQRQAEGRTSFEVIDQRGSLRILRQPSPWSLTTSFGERARDLVESLLG